MNNVPPELEDSNEIDRLLNQAFPAKIQAGIGKALKGLVIGVVNTRLAITGLFSSIGSIKSELENLNKNIQNADVSSKKLTTAIKNATIAAAVIAALGVLIATATLAFDMYKYFHPVQG